MKTKSKIWKKVIAKLKNEVSKIKTDDIIRSTTAETISFFELEAPRNTEYKELITMLRRRFGVCE